MLQASSMENKPPKIIIFDFDGTIADSIDTINHLFKSFDPSLTDEKFTSLSRGNTKTFVKEFNQKHRIDITQEYAPLVPQQKIFNGLGQAIQDLAQDYRLFIISISYTKPINEFLKNNGLALCFEEVIGSDKDRDKTHAMTSILATNHISPKNALTITDTNDDIRHAHATGLKSIAVTWGRQDQVDLEKANPATIINEVSELVPAINQILPVTNLS